MSDTKYTASFILDIVGNNTGEKWSGTFKVKTRLSFRDELRQDQLWRALIGSNGAEHAGPRAVEIADLLAYLQIRILESPEWWTRSGAGTELEDDNVLQEIAKLTSEESKKVSEELKKKAEEARKSLSKE